MIYIQSDSQSATRPPLPPTRKHDVAVWTVNLAFLPDLVHCGSSVLEGYVSWCGPLAWELLLL